MHTVEHIGIMVDSPVEMAKWYNRVLGFEIALSSGDGNKGVAFMRIDQSGTMIELIGLPGIESTKNRLNHHLQFHLALKSEDLEKDSNHLIDNGAKLIEKCPVTINGDELIVLYDPWGNCIQLAKRGINRFT